MARSYGWSHAEMMALPPALLAAYARLARRLGAEEELSRLDTQMTCLATLHRPKGGRNHYAERRRRLLALSQGEAAGTPLAEVVRGHLARSHPERLALFERAEPGPAERRLREKVGGGS